MNAIEEMKDDPFRGDVRKLRGGLEGFCRRVGNWRILFDVRRARQFNTVAKAIFVAR
jgi:hypothetical protein